MKEAIVVDLITLEENMETNKQFADPPMLLRTARAGGFFRTNASFRAKVGWSEAELADEPFLHWINPADIEVAVATIEGRQASCRVEHRTRDGEHVPLEIRVVYNDGESMVLARWVEDVEVLEGPEDSDDKATVSGTLHTIARIVENQNPSYKCSILLVADGRFVRGAGPSLPEEYNAAIDGFAIGPTVGSCGTAIYWNVPVIVEDIQADPLWTPFAELAKRAGVAACWSHPFASKTGNVLGALALYSPVPRVPTLEELGRLKAAAHMTGLAVERGRAEEALRAQRKHELELEEQLRQAYKMEALGVLAGGVAHDFNNILTSIIGFTELALDDVEKESNIEDNLQEVYNAGLRAKDLVRQILAFARKSDEELKPIRIDLILNEVLKFIRSSIPSSIEVESNVKSESLIMGNATQIHQILMNLCTNAAYAMETEGGVLAVYLDDIVVDGCEKWNMLGLRQGSYIEIKVSDTGEGIARENIDAIFEPYFTTKEVGEGTGMGLALVHGIVESYGGKIMVESTLGEGSVFAIYLPLTKERKTHRLYKSEVLPTGTGHILLVDDEDQITKMMSQILDRLGYSVTTCSSSLDALELFRLKSNEFDLVITDMTMPKMTGDKLAIELMKIRPDIPVILCTGYSKKMSDETAIRIGIKAFAYKPIEKADLANTVRKVLSEAKVPVNG